MAQPDAPTVAPFVREALIALVLQPEDGEVPQSTASEGDVILFASFVVILVLVFGFDMFRT